MGPLLSGRIGRPFNLLEGRRFAHVSRTSLASAALVLLATLAVLPPAQASSNRVLGGVSGSTVALELTSHVVALGDPTRGNPAGQLFCTGSVIDPYWVVTARHCVEDERGSRTPASAVAVLRGPGNGNTIDPGGVGNDVAAVVNIVIAPGDRASMSARGADIALLQLSAPLRTATPIAIADPSESGWWGAGAGRPTGTYVAGFGVTQDNPRAPMTPDLQYAELGVWSTAQCLASSQDPVSARVNLCAGTSTTANCFGDSGGPLVAIDPARVGAASANPDAARRLIGVVSYSEADSCLAKPGFYTPVATNAAWIRSVITGTPLPPTPKPTPTPVVAPTVAPSPDVTSGSAPSGLELVGQTRRGFYAVRVQVPESSAIASYSIAAIRSPGRRTQVLSSGPTPQLTIDLPPTRSGRITLVATTYSADGSTLGSYTREVRTLVDRRAPARVPGARIRRVGSGAVLSWGRPSDNDIVAELLVQGRHGYGRWQTVRTITCSQCWAPQLVSTIRSQVRVPRVDRRDSFRLIAIDRAGNGSITPLR